LITQGERIVSVKPYEANVTSVRFVTSTGENWLYMAHDISDMNVTLTADVGIYGGDGALLADFNSTCYGRDIDLHFQYETDTDSEVGLTLDGNLTDYGNSINDINKSVRFPVKLFDAGKAESGYAFGIDRNCSSPSNPVYVKLKKVSIATAGLAKYTRDATETGVMPSDAEAIFYYGRIDVDDLRTTQAHVNHPVSFEVYASDSSNSYVSGMVRSSLEWYLNSLHDRSGFGSVETSDSAAYAGTFKSGETLGVDIESVTHSGDGTASLSINIDPGVKGVIHLDINASRWLWYVPAGMGGDYNFSSGSDCTSHPCFNIIRENSTSNIPVIESGRFRGSDFDADDRGDREKSGIKVFR